MIYLVEVDCLDEADRPVTLRYSDCGLMTSPGDDPPNTFYAPRVGDPGNIERHLFSEGRTFGELSIGVGDVLLKNTDHALDHLRRFAFDGRSIRIWSMVSRFHPFSSRQLCLEGTMAQTEFQDGEFAITVRDWLEALRQPVQTTVYAGTTKSSGSTVAEGGDDLKDKTKSLLYGTVRHIPATLVDAFEHIYEIGSNGVSMVTGVQDAGVPLPLRGDYPTLAALKAATLVPGEAATCLALGLLRLGGNPAGLVTADASEGGTPALRTAAQLVQRILLKMEMKPGEDYSEEDLARLDAAAPQECGVRLEPDSGTTALGLIAFILGSVGASLSPDFAGVYRVERLATPTLEASRAVVDEAYIIGPGEELDRDSPSDQSDGLPFKKIVVRYARNPAVVDVGEVDSQNIAAEYRAFISEEWRQALAESPATAARHLLAHEVTFDTALCSLADAQAEANRRLELYRVVREVFRVTLPFEYSRGVDLSDVVTLRARSFGLESGRPFVVIGVLDEYEPGHRTLTLWG